MDPKFALPPPAPEIQVKSSPPSPHSSQGMGEPRAQLEEEVEDLDEQQRAGYLAEKEGERQEEDDLNTLLEISIRMEEEKEKEKEKEGKGNEKQQEEGM